MTRLEPPEELDFSELLRAIAASWRVIPVAILCALAGSLVYALRPAPPEYHATVHLRGLPQNYCPAVLGGCEVPLEMAVSQAVENVLAPVDQDLTRELLGSGPDAVLPEPVAPPTPAIERANIVAEGRRVTVSVSDLDGDDAVRSAKIIAGMIASQINDQAERARSAAETSIRLELATLRAPRAVEDSTRALIEIRAAELEARLASVLRFQNSPPTAVAVEGGIALVSVPQRAGLGLVLGMGFLLGLVVGVGLALALSLRRGSLHSSRLIADTFADSDVIFSSRRDLRSVGTPLAWQEVRLALGEDIPTIVGVVGLASTRTVKAAVRALYDSMSDAGKNAAIVDAGDWFGRRKGADTADPIEAWPGVAAYGCDASDLPRVVETLREKYGTLLLLAPSIRGDLQGVSETLRPAPVHVIVAETGIVTRLDAWRVRLAERRTAGRRIVVAVV